MVIFGAACAKHCLTCSLCSTSACFLLVFIVTRDLYQTLFAVLYGMATAHDMSAFQVSAGLRTLDMVGMFVMGLAAIVLVIMIQATYERARSGVQLGARFATVFGLQVAVDRRDAGPDLADAGGRAPRRHWTATRCCRWWLAARPSRLV